MTAAGARARVRAELTREITEAARRHLASEGAAALSLRAVARELGMASSAVYRYFPSRDDLLTALIVDAYNALGAAAEEADSWAASTGSGAEGLRARWRAVCRATRGWAVAHPHEYALVYGSPVPGYRAPPATVDPAARVGGALCRIVADGIAAGLMDPATDPTRDRALGATAGPETSVEAGGDGNGGAADGSGRGAHGGGADAFLVPGIAEQIGLPGPSGSSSLAARAILAWTTLFGLISFELFGHTHNVVEQHERFFDDATDRLAALLGLPSPAP